MDPLDGEQKLLAIFAYYIEEPGSFFGFCGGKDVQKTGAAADGGCAWVFGEGLIVVAPGEARDGRDATSYGYRQA